MNNQQIVLGATCGQIGHQWDGGICMMCASVDSSLLPASHRFQAPREAQPTDGNAGPEGKPEQTEEQEA